MEEFHRTEIFNYHTANIRVYGVESMKTERYETISGRGGFAMKIYRKHTILVMIILALIFSACSLTQSSNPTSESKKLFEEWTLQAGVPYKNA